VTFRRNTLHDKYWKPLLRRTGLPNTRFHDLRYTCATLLLTKGVHPKIVSEMLGHSSIAITLDTYSHVIPGLGEVVASAIEGLLRDDTDAQASRYLGIYVPQVSCSVPFVESDPVSALAEYKLRRRQPSWRSRLEAALMSARWVKACGKLPKASPEGPISSA